jgi:DNA-binding NarL/FixJ family response regulator
MAAQSQSSQAQQHLSGQAMSVIFQAFMAKQTEYPEAAPTLSPREIEIMEQFLDPTAEAFAVSRTLSIAPSTLDRHLANIYSKLGVDNLRKAVWRFVLIYRQYFADFFVFYLKEAHAGLNALAA